MDFSLLCGTGLAQGFGLADRVVPEAAALAGFPDPEAYRRHLAGRTACLTMLAGAGTRWISSLGQASSLPEGYSLDMPRALFPVKNYLGRGPDPLPIGAYALAALRGLGRHIIAVRGWEEAIAQRILKPLGIDASGATFVTQREAGGKPRGHGDAAYQAMDAWRGSEYVVVNFGGDASGPDTAFRALAVMDALGRQEDPPPSLVLPVAQLRSPAYPIAVDASGRPSGFGHAKLAGKAKTGGPESDNAKVGQLDYTNVGLRVYRSADLERLLIKAAADWRRPDGLWAVPGNDPEGGEFALDNADAAFARSGRARLLAVARPEELTPVKALADVPGFEAAASRLWGAAR